MPSTFMRLMHHVLTKYFGKFIVVYIDDILVYNLYREEHLHNLRMC